MACVRLFRVRNSLLTLKDKCKQKWQNSCKTVKRVKYGKKPTHAQICKIKSRPVHRYLCQFNQLVFHHGVLHRVYEQDGAKYHQLILPIEFRAQVMELFHDEQGHQAVEHILQLVWEWFLLEYSASRSDKLGKKCKLCQTAKGPYTDPNPSQGSIVANYPIDLLCIDFMKVDLSKDGKENVLVITNAFSNLVWQLLHQTNRQKQ